MKIDLPIQEYNRWRVVAAEIVDVAEWLPGSFAVYRNPYMHTGNGPAWRVANIETGAYCGEGPTKRLAVENARARALAVSREKYLRLVRRECRTRPQILDTSVAA